MNVDRIKREITRLELRITEYQNALDSIIAGHAQEYIIDSGQTRQRVTKLDVARMEELIDSMENRLRMYYHQLNNSNVSLGKPAW